MMRYRLAYLLAVVVFLAAVSACFAVPAPVSIVKYSQPPIEDGGYDFASYVPMVESTLGTGFVMFDDWICPDGQPVTDIHWWGSYWAPPTSGPLLYSDFRQNADPIQLEGFEIVIYSDIPADDPDNPYGFSIPNLDDELYAEAFDGNANETFAFTDVKATDGNGDPTIWEDVYKYGVNLTTPFEQTEGSIYWLAILAIGEDSGVQWGWHNSDTHVADYAVQATFSGEGLGDFYLPCGGVDMAFELTTVPEPGSLLALGMGFSGLAGMIIRKRRAR